MAEHVLDTNFLSKLFYGDLGVKQFVEDLDVGIETVVYIESIQGSIAKKDRERIKRSLSKIKYYSLTPEIAIQANDLIDTHSAANGLFLGDAMIASTALYYDLTLTTYNRKHFRFIDRLRIIRP